MWLIIVESLDLFFWLLIGHAVADFALQHEGMIRGKNKNVSQPGPNYDPEVHGPPQTTWPFYLTAHALIHAGLVGVITGSTIWAVYEFIMHWALDYSKMSRYTTMYQDQAFHVLTKALIVWVMFIIRTTPA